MKTRYFLFLFYFFFTQSLYNQELVGNVQSLNMSEGLSHYKVLSFLEGEKGMWIGTADGLNFYDGFNWQHWKKEDHQINFDQVSLILGDQNDHLWLFDIKWTEGNKYLRGIDVLPPDSKKPFLFLIILENRCLLNLKLFNNLFKTRISEFIFLQQINYGLTLLIFLSAYFIDKRI